MSMYQSFDASSVQVMRKAIEVALEPLGKQFGMEFSVGNIKYTAAKLNADVSCVIGAKEDYDKTTFEKLCSRFGLKPHHYNQEFEYAGKKYRVIGFNTKAPKYPIKAKDSSGGITRFPIDIIRNTLLIQYP